MPKVKILADHFLVASQREGQGQSLAASEAVHRRVIDHIQQRPAEFIPGD